MADGGGCALTAVWFPARYWELVKEFDPLASWLVLARGVTLLALLAVLTWPATGPARLDRARPPRRRVARDDRALEAHAAGRRLEPDGHPGAHPADCERRLDPDHGVVRPGHPDVGDRGRAAGQDAGVGRLDVRVRPEHRRHAAVEPRGERHLLARRLRVQVDHNDGSRGASVLDQLVDDLPHAVRGVEEERSEQVDHRDRGAVTGIHDGQAAPRSGSLEVGRPDDRPGRCEVGPDLLAAPRVVPEGQRVGAGGQQPFRQPRRDPHAVRDVLAVDDAEIDVETLADPREQRLDRVTAGPPDHVADEQDPHRLRQRAGRRIDGDGDVVAAVGGVQAKACLSTEAMFDRRAELRGRGEHGSADRDRRVGPDVHHRDHHRG